jgi:hypothetical protein
MAEVGPRPIVSDARIESYLAERKQLPTGWMTALRFTEATRGHYESELEVAGEDGHTFEIRLRQSVRDSLSFSAILSILDVEGLRRFRIRRYNGRSHGHRNRLEREQLSIGFHIHYATERYQLAGFREDAFAVPCDRYTNVWDALSCLIAECGFVDDDDQMRMF